MAAKGVSTTAQPLESADYYRLIEYLERDKQYRWALFCIVACTMGLRVSDVKNLIWEEILFGEIHFIKEGKTGKTRRVRINDSVQHKLREYYNRLGRPDLKQLLFFNKRTGRAYTTQNINYHLRCYKEKYELPIRRFSSHSFRKTFGKKIYEDNGKSEYGLMLVNRTFRHASLQMSQNYIDDRQSAMDGIYDSFQFNNL